MQNTWFLGKFSSSDQNSSNRREGLGGIFFQKVAGLFSKGIVLFSKGIVSPQNANFFQVFRDYRKILPQKIWKVLVGKSQKEIRKSSLTQSFLTPTKDCLPHNVFGRLKFRKGGWEDEEMIR